LIREVERYHGVVLARLVRGGGKRSVSIEPQADSRAAYLIDGRVGLFVKYSTSRLSPWAFTFSNNHRLELERLRKSSRTVLVALVCGNDGVACLTLSELRGLLEVGPGGVAAIRASRGRRQKYVIRAGSRKNLMRIGDNEFPAKVFSAMG
jgi:hypothetical protein